MCSVVIGKTMVAEIILFRRLIATGKKVLFVLPYVSVVVEKVKDLQEKLATLGLCVRGYHSGAGDNAGRLTQK